MNDFKKIHRNPTTWWAWALVGTLAILQFIWYALPWVMIVVGILAAKEIADDWNVGHAYLVAVWLVVFMFFAAMNEWDRKS